MPTSPTPLTHRDKVRAARHETMRKAASLGVNMDAERIRDSSNQRMLTFESAKLVNDPTPRVTRERQQVDDLPGGAFNGVNTSFLLTSPVAGQNIVVVWGDTNTPQTKPLIKSTNSPPAQGEFFFDPNDPTTFVVGSPPLAADRLIAVYMVER